MPLRHRLAVVLLALASLAGTARSTTTLRGSFLAEPAARWGWYVEEADLDGDGLDEIVASVGTAPTDSMLVYRFGPPGTPAVRTRFATQSDDEIVTDEGDVNADGRDDLVASGPEAIVIYLGQGDASVEAHTLIAVPSGETWSADLGDVIGDAADDVILSQSVAGAVQLLEGHIGGLPTASMAPLSTVGGPAKAWARDVNGDGRNDIVVLGVAPSVRVAVHLALDGGGFAPPVSFDSEVAVDVASMDGDEHVDLVTTAGVRPGLGDGTFGALVPADHEVTGAADLDEDGRLDLYGTTATTALTGGELRVQRARGDGTFEPSAAGPALPSSIGNLLAAVDVDHDSHVDVVGLSWDQDALVVYRGTGDGRFDAPPRYPAATEPRAVRAADIDDDSRPDLLVATDGALEWRHGAGDGTFGASTLLPTLAGTRHVRTADLDGDGDADVVTAVTSPVSFSVWRNDPGALAPRVDVSVGGSSGNLWLLEASGDSRPDVLVSSSGSIVRYTNDGSGGFSTGTPIGIAATALAGADVDHDGDLDLVSVFSSALRVHPRTGPDTFGPAVPVSYSSPGGTTPSLAVGDFDGDGWTDAAVYSSALFVFAGQPGGSFASPVRYDLQHVLGGGVSPGLFAADVNGDGALDLVTSRGGLGAAVVWHGRGDRTFLTEHVIGAVRAGLSLDCDVADLDGDARPDVLVSSGVGGFGEVGVLLNGVQVTGAPVAPVAPSRLRLALAANPVGARLQGTLHGAVGRVDLDLLDVSGRRLRHVRLEASNGAPRAFDLGPRAELPPGQYVLLARSGGERTASRVTVLR